MTRDWCSCCSPSTPAGTDWQSSRKPAWKRCKGACMTRAIIEQRAILRRSGGAEEVPDVEESECGTLSIHRFEVESPEAYDEILVSAAEEMA